MPYQMDGLLLKVIQETQHGRSLAHGDACVQQVQIGEFSEVRGRELGVAVVVARLSLLVADVV